MVLDALEPKKVFYFFEEICKIPHGSGNVEKISNYIVQFAKERHLVYTQDEMKNVIIVKPASVGYENEPGIIIQGHMDMVAVKKESCQKDMAKEGLDLKTSGDKIYAEGTSLGGDDGIAVAYALAILDDDTIKHPKLEVIITVDEEVGMDGATAIDLSGITGKRMLNLDSEEEGIFLTSCAGGIRVNSLLPVKGEKNCGEVYRISIEGLLGGHSGEMITKERGNANSILGRVLYQISTKLPIRIISIQGGSADNAIPRHSLANVFVESEDQKEFKRLLLNIEDDIKEELGVKDPDFQITTILVGEEERVCANVKESLRMATMIYALPNGLCAMSADVKGLAETSLNLGIMKYDGDEGILLCAFSVRSSKESAKWSLVEKIEAITSLAGGTITQSGNYPGWAYRVDSPLRDKMIALYKEMYGVEPEVQAIHAGLECGILASKIQDLDCISFGPNMECIHTTEETLSISSVKRVWEYVINLLSKKG